MVDNTAKKQRGRPFEPGCSGNPAGRPKGSRNKFGEEFVAAIAQDWAEHGSEVLARVRQASPATYLRTVASLVPQHLAITEDADLSNMISRLPRLPNGCVCIGSDGGRVCDV
jgi:hypothetical protein